MRSFLAIFCLLYSINSFSSVLVDSIGVENNNGNTVILHKVLAKESYYSIARIYQTTPKSIIDFNNNIALKIGTILKVPTGKPFVNQAASAAVNKRAVQVVSSSQNTPSPATSQVATATGTPGNTFEYKVGPREYLYLIARKFNTTAEEIKRLNNLTSNSLKIGQILIIKTDGPKPEPEATTEIAIAPADEEPEEKFKVSTGRLGISEKSERGVATWIADENLDGTKMLALHRYAPVGTVMKVTNPMTDKTTFVKIVGRFTENESTKDVIIVLTQATATLLGVRDKRFQVSIDYGVPNE